MSEKNFDQIARHYDHALPAHIAEHYLNKRVRYIVENCSPGLALDVGCGTGVLAGRLARAGFEVTGLDPSQGMLDVMAESQPQVEGVRGDGAALPFEDGSFDLTLTVAALHHIADPDAVRRTLIEMARVTKPGGQLVVWDHNPRNPYWKSLMARVPQDDGSERLISEAEIDRGLREGGAEILSSQQLGLVPEFVPARLLGLTASCERVAERTPLVRRFCAHNVVLARGGQPGARPVRRPSA
jgi:SAM-dependent methyltransferase